MSSWSDVTGMLSGDFDWEVADAFNRMVPLEAHRSHINNERMARSYLRNAFRRTHRRRRHRLERQAMIAIARRRNMDIADHVGSFLGQNPITWRPSAWERYLASYAPGGSRAPTGPPQNEATQAIWGRHLN